MPVTIFTSDNDPGQWLMPNVDSDSDLLAGSRYEEYERSIRIVQSSFGGDLFCDNHISASTNGFLYTLFNAYSDHLHVTLRPEDVWFAILTQLSFYINAHAEELRSYFVAHDGTKELETVGDGTLDTSNVGALALEMTRLIQKNVVEPGLREWIMPTFSTTTESDRVVAAVLMMGSMQKYFSYTMSFLCGIPSVTLLGHREDWEDILHRLEKMTQLGEEPATFTELLRPILRHFVASFDAPARPDVLSFWKRAVDRREEGSGVDYITGWMSAFCFWDSEGKRIPHTSSENGAIIDGVKYHAIDTDQAPLGSVSVPVTINDNGHEFPARMVAGSVGIRAEAAGRTHNNAVTAPDSDNPTLAGNNDGDDNRLDSISPVTGWWMYEAKSDSQVEQEEEERREGIRSMMYGLGGRTKKVPTGSDGVQDAAA
ncbi:hypothetical protein QBC33DRAFT_501428 [Phialemonium atrogriseum]|uniref:Uncharacterized protein n=1 Tax=Phialemonium atrogriseum TaxID=1093897 RepID=A0AAJ0BPZ5_9PEZI|nr:uncharacterized protein QBC33DRAFT_501428 [Phialemonium atrogriseum]KAK1762323.1 hypothetical protein QBC33DRAFT_501428 [Phialemonium atrogriseum]